MSEKVSVRFCLLLCLSIVPLLAPLPAGGQGPAARATPQGFDGDVYADLAIGVPGESVGSVVDAGAVNVLYGTAGDLSTARGQFWHQNDGGDDAPQTEDEFGISLAAGDLNGDGYGDLATGVQWEDVDGVTDAGAVNVVYGSQDGLVLSSGQFWHQGLPGVEGELQAGAGFGRHLTIGDFDGDGFDDLAVGMPWQTLGPGLEAAGAVHVFYGSPDGLTASRDEMWSQDNPDVIGDPGANDHFGRALAAGDFDGDGFDDLAIGIPEQDIGARQNAGRVVVMYGAAGGLSAPTSQVWDQNNPEIEGKAEQDDLFGAALSTGDFDADGYDDLLVGIPHEDVAGQVDAGAVIALYGTPTGLSVADNRLWNQAVAFQEGPEADDMFGTSLATGDMDGDGYDDAAIGVPFEDLDNAVDAGGVNVLYGSGTGLIADGNHLWYQGLQQLQESPETDDNFGAALAIADMDGDGYDDLCVGVPGEGFPFDGTERSRAGVVQIIFGSVDGLTVTGNYLLRQDHPHLADDPETDDLFGFDLAALGAIEAPAFRYRTFLPLVFRNY